MDGVIIGAIISLMTFTGVTLVIFIYGYTRCILLARYLKKNHYALWREMTSIGSLGPGLANPIRGRRFLYSDKGNEDETVLRYKDSIRLNSQYCKIGLGAIVVMFVMIITLIWLNLDNGFKAWLDQNLAF